jgi:4-diphosphocytidyl-2-C-methyl-D-erythritol kinase
VSGIGEVVEEFNEELLDIETYTPEIQISTPLVYQTYRRYFYAPIDVQKVEVLKMTRSKDILNTMSAKEANDLFVPALHEYKELENFYQVGYHFSGSGSSFFKIKEKELHG